MPHARRGRVRALPPLTGAILLLPASLAFGQTDSAEPEEGKSPEEPAVLEELVVVGVRERLAQAGLLEDTIERTEVVTGHQLDSRQATTLTEALALSPGVWVSNECSMCGVKRLMINGLRGEHTTILTDGIPTHTMLSGFYGIDAMPTAGIQRIEIARGAGASLIAPEAIGGTVNIVPVDPVQSLLDVDLSAGSQDLIRGRIVGAWVNDQGTTRLSASLQIDERGQYDNDGNGVSESPLLDNRSLALRLSHDLDLRSNLTARIGFYESEVFGGPMIGELTPSIDAALASFANGATETPFGLFAGGDVNNRFLGLPWETTEWIDTERREASLAYLREIGDRLSVRVTAGYTAHTQDSFYEGIDYRADDDLIYADARGHYRLGDAHLLTFGTDLRHEEMRSASDALAASPDFVSDGFDYDVVGLYLQDTWTPNERLSVAAALRVDRVEADFVDPSKAGTEASDTIVAPRIDARYDHSETWTSRVSVGRGYRAPLAFFETDHGILDQQLGFLVDIDRLERSLSGSYALSYAGERLTGTGSVTVTQVDDLAILDESPEGVPLLTQLRDQTGQVVAADLTLGYRFARESSLSLGFEHYEYDDVFRQAYGIAPVEARVTAGLDLHWRAFELVTNATCVGGRDLGDYGYEGFDRVLPDGTPEESSRKTLDAPAFTTVDSRLSWQATGRMQVYAGVYNLFDEVQEVSPLFYDADGGFDVGYIFGPLRGRQWYAGFSFAF